jgi:fucose permease
MKLTYKHTLYACYIGYITQAIIVNLAPILFIVFQDKFHITFEMIGRLVLINFGTQLVTDALAVNYADKIGIRRAAILGHVASALGLLALGILPNVMADPYLGLVIAVIIYAFGGGLIEVLISPTVDSLPGDAKDSAMSLLHSFYAWGQVAVVLLSTIYIKLFGADHWFWLPLLWMVVPLFNLVNFARVPLVPAVAAEERMPLKRLLSSRVFMLAMLLMVCAGASEQAIAQWASLFAEKGLGVPKLMGDLLGPCSFAAMLGLGRMIYGLWGEKFNLKKALFASSFLCVACYATTVFVQIPLISLLGCAMSGFAVSIMWPGMLRLSSRRYPMGGTAMFGVLAIMGDLGCSIGPWMAGAASDLAKTSTRLMQLGASYGLNPDQVGLKSGILIAIIFPILLLAGVLLFKDDLPVLSETWGAKPEPVAAEL